MFRAVSLFALVLLIGCKQNQHLVQVYQFAEEVRSEFAPDKRVALFRVDTIFDKQILEIHGETNLPKAKEAFYKKLEKAGIKFSDSLQLLPSPNLLGKIFGVVNVSVCNIRSEPKHSAELATQALLGVTLRVFKKQGDFYLVQSPDDYFGWLDDGGFELMTREESENWLNAERGIITTDFDFAYQNPDESTAKMTDLLAGDIVKIVEVMTKFTKIEMPDGRIGFVKNASIMPVTTWLATRKANPENILATASGMMGRPYLWGGTSGKGMDCSGFTKMTYFLNGIHLPRDASQQVNVGQTVETDTSSLKNLEPGDLLFFGRKATPEKKERITHVAIYMGDGKIIHASDRVKVESLVRGDSSFVEDRLATFVRSKRILGQEGKNGVYKVIDSPFYRASKNLQD